MLSLDRERYLTAGLGSVLELGRIVIEVTSPRRTETGGGCLGDRQRVTIRIFNGMPINAVTVRCAQE
jgi:hypothetical protein